jgi:hypothetical protein
MGNEKLTTDEININLLLFTDNEERAACTLQQGGKIHRHYKNYASELKSN